MRIYLDSNIFQALKRESNKDIYDLILIDKHVNYYCFTEAHIQDLVRDKSPEKFTDMKFIETIVDNNCWYYNKGMEVKFLTPREYYNDYDWDEGTDIMRSEDSFITLIRESFRVIPLNFQQLIDMSLLPSDFPDDLKPMLLEPANMLDFMDAMLDLTDNLSNEQSRFKRLLQYLHRTVAIQSFYENLGIKGFDGANFTDWDAFVESFKTLVYQRSYEKDLYSLFVGMQFSLDSYGILKGKPKKQKFVSLLNDGKHAYYAGHAHMLVSNDADMIAKTRLVYKIWDIEIPILTLEEFKQYLIDTSSKDNSAAALFAQFNYASELPILSEQYSLGEFFVQKELSMWYLEHFNTLTCASARGITYYYFKQWVKNIPLATLTIELERVTNKLVEHLGTDELGQGKLNRNELKERDWKGREWRSGEMGIILNETSGIMLSFFRAAPAKDNRQEIVPSTE